MNLETFKTYFHDNLQNGYKTKDVDKFNKTLIKQKIDVSFLKDIILKKQEYHRTYFQVSLGLIDNINDQFKFIEDNKFNLEDRWHVDQLQQFINKSLSLEYAINKATSYVYDPHPFMRRWGYVLFMPTLCKDPKSFELIIKLFHNDDHYYVIMAEAWLISYLAIYFPDKTLEFLKNTSLDYKIVSKSISKITESYRISDEIKTKFKEIRNKYYKNEKNINSL